MGWESLNYFPDLTEKINGHQGLEFRWLNSNIHEHSWYPKKVEYNVILKMGVPENNVFLLFLTPMKYGFNLWRCLTNSFEVNNSTSLFKLNVFFAQYTSWCLDFEVTIRTKISYWRYHYKSPCYELITCNF